MLVLLSFALVLAATVLLVLGLLNDGLTLIYLSIACSVAAAVVLIVALRRNKPRVEAKAPPAPLPVEGRPAPAPAPAPTPVPAGAAAATAASVAAVDARGEWLASDFAEPEEEVDEGEEVDFPIADYDDLTAGQILPLLPQLYADEIGVVEARERATKGRPEILERLAELQGDVPEAIPVAPAPAWAGDDEWFPIEDYESLSAAQIRPLLGELDAEELALVRDREMVLGRRRSLLDDIDRRLGVPSAFEAAPSLVGTPDSPPAAPVPAAPAKKAPAKKAPAKKAAAPARKAPAKKAAAPAKTTPAKKAAAPARKAPAKKAAAPAKTTPAKKAAAPAKKAAAPAKKAPAKKAAAPAKKTPAKKAAAPAKKAAAPAKKATKKST